MVVEPSMERSSLGLCSAHLRRRDLADVVVRGLLLSVPHDLHGSWAEASGDGSICSHIHPFLTLHGCIDALDQR